MITTDQYNRLLARMTRLEDSVNDLMVAMNAMVSRSEVQQLLTLTQADLEDIQATVDALEDRVENIESEPLT